MTHRRQALRVLLCALAGATSVAIAAGPSLQIQQVFSNADGAVQFVLLRETAGQSGQDQLAGRTLTSTHAGVTATYTFPSNLPTANTANHAVLIATQGYVTAANSVAEFHTVAPDYVIPDRFLSAEGGTVDFAGADHVDYPPLPNDGFTAFYRGGATRDNAVSNFAGAAATLPPIPVGAVEYYNAALDHYFISDLAPDLDALDTGRFAGWSRTGKTFKVWPISLGFLSDVCRFYIPPEHGNSHFFSGSATECATVSGLVGTNPNFSGYVLETSAVFSVALPDDKGACPYQWIPVYRLWNQRADSNHRYTIDPAVKAAMIAKGYVAEGYGNDAVAMCSPL